MKEKKEMDGGMDNMVIRRNWKAILGRADKRRG
jgi:hypothetical protein